MKTTPPWTRLKDLAAQERDASAQKLAQSIRVRDEAEKKLVTLLGYRTEYEVRLATSSVEGIDATTLRNYRTFLAQLDKAVALQRDCVANAQRDMDRATQLWITDHKRTETFQILDERVVGQQAAAARRAEQKQADEWVSQTHSRRTTSRR